MHFLDFAATGATEVGVDIAKILLAKYFLTLETLVPTWKALDHNYQELPFQGIRQRYSQPL